MQRLTNLNLKEGDTVTYNDLGKKHSYTVLGRSPEGWRLQTEDGKEFVEEDFGYFATDPKWTLKPQPKEIKVTPIKDLNLVVGDRIQSGDWTGTYLGIARHHPFYYQVVWDWCSDCGYYALEAMVDWVRLPQTEPTLTSLDLKVGDPVLLGVGVVLVKQITETDVVFTMVCGSPLKIRKSHPLKQFTRCQKLEVPK